MKMPLKPGPFEKEIRNRVGPEKNYNDFLDTYYYGNEGLHSIKYLLRVIDSLRKRIQ